MKIGFEGASYNDIPYIEFNDSDEDTILLGHFMLRIKSAPKDSLDKVIKINYKAVHAED